jgi:hypothetical protein
MSIISPVLITIWDRPEYVKELLNAISKVKPQRIYVYSDTVNDKTSERYNNIMTCRGLVNQMINWESEILYRYNETSEGPSIGIHNAISWAFESTDRLIILEHDYIPSKSFFYFCDSLLDKYLNDQRIWIISGLNHFEGRYNLNENDSYFFSSFASIFGFATWKRCWNHVENKMESWPTFVSKNYKLNYFDKSISNSIYKKFEHFYNERILSNNLNTWDLQFVFAILANSGTGIVPAVNLIKAVGLDGYNSSLASPFHFLSTNDNFKIENHPDFIQNNHLYDSMFINSNCFIDNRSVLKKIVDKILKNLSFKK